MYISKGAWIILYYILTNNDNNMRKKKKPTGLNLEQIHLYRSLVK